MNEDNVTLAIIEDDKSHKYGSRYLTVGVFHTDPVTKETVLIKQETFWLPKVEQE